MLGNGTNSRAGVEERLQDLIRDLEELPSSLKMATTLYSKVEQGVREGMEFVVRTPEAHPFWAGVQEEPTLGAFWRALLDNDASDTRALWIRIADNIGSCFGFDRDVWLRINALGMLDIQWPIYATWDCFYRSGSDLGKPMVELIQELNCTGSAYTILASMPQEASWWSQKWLGRLYKAV